MTKLRNTLIALPFVAAVALGACGDDDSDDASDTTEASSDALTEAEFVAQANTLCSDAGGEAETAMGPVFEDFEAATPEQLQDAYDRMVELARGLTADIGDLAAPADLQAEVDEWLTIFDAATDEIEEGGAGAFFASEGDPWLDANPGAEALGLDECAEA